MRPTWLFEADVFGPRIDSLKLEIRRQGLSSQTLPFHLLAAGVVSDIRDDDCVIACGSFPFLHEVQARRWTPGAWCNTTAFCCDVYFPFFGASLLNHFHTILSVDEAISRVDELFEQFAANGQIFVRPTSCEKQFAGGVVGRQTFIDALGPTRFDLAARILVAPAQSVQKEWRLVIADGQPIAGSQYRDAGQTAILRDTPSDVFRFAEAALRAADWRPNPLFVLDVCEAAGELRIVEAGPFSGCSLYDCDPQPIVTTASHHAAAAWAENHGR